MAVAAVSTILLSPLSASPNSGAAVTDTHTSVRVTAAVAPELLHVSRTDPTVGAGTLRKTTSASESEVVSADVRGVRCKSARRGTAWYRQRQRDWLKLRGVETTARAPNGGLSNRSAGTRETPRKPRNCADARYLAQVAKRRSFAARQEYGRWLEWHTLRDFRVTPDSNAWQKAVQEAQRVYPGTRGWLLSCSASEGGWGRWVPNSQGSGVGGWLQYQPGTFTGFYNAARTHVTSRGFRVPSSAASWYSPLGQALAGGWAITHGMRHHWAGTGC